MESPLTIGKLVLRLWPHLLGLVLLFLEGRSVTFTVEESSEWPVCGPDTAS